jgi:pyruvyltransferase
MRRQRALGLYWWSPSHDARTALWELRRNRDAWFGMVTHGGGMLRNFGDELSRRIVAEVSGRRVRWAPPESASVTGIGSVLEHVAAADGPGAIWGAGLRRSEFAPSAWANRRPSRFLAVRGELTRDALGLDASTPLGDPGLIVRALYRRSTRPRGIVVIPHFLAFKSHGARRQMAVARSRGMRVLAPSASYERICEEVSRAELVLSSSLHGMVVADALDCPVQLVSFGETAEPSFKFADYESVFGSSSAFVSLTEVLESRMAGVFDRAAVRSQNVRDDIDDIVERLLRSGLPLADLG